MPELEFGLSTEFDSFQLFSPKCSEKKCCKCNQWLPLNRFRKKSKEAGAPRHNVCSACRIVCDRILRETRTADGLCGLCGVSPKPESGHACHACRESLARNHRSMSQRRLSQGLCAHCGINSRVGGSTKCGDCILRRRAASCLGDHKRWNELKVIWDKQGEICPYSGIKMSLENSDVDHIVSRAKGGRDDPGNLQFVYRPFNQMKNAHSESEFLSLIQIAYRHCAKVGKIKEINESLVPYVQGGIAAK